MSPNPWRALEEIPGLTAFASAWQARMGQEGFRALSHLCLDPAQWTATSVPCPRGCGCAHYVILRHDGEGGVAVCRCQPAVCPDIPLTRSQVTPLELNWAKLARALCGAFGLRNRFLYLTPPNTAQVGAWSAEAVPTILTVQVFPEGFRSAVAELTATLRRPFILFTPTATHLDAPCQSMLEQCGAACFPLDAHLLITERGTLQSRRVPGELFARFTPQPKPVDEELSRRAVALVSQFDAQTFTVFRLYCIGGLSAQEVARRLRCSKTTILRRLEVIRAMTGVEPKHLRTLSPHLAQLEANLADARAHHLHRMSVL